MSVTCFGTLLSEFSFDQAQQQAIIDFIELSNTTIPNAFTRECSKQELSEELAWLVATTQTSFLQGPEKDITLRSQNGLNKITIKY